MDASLYALPENPIPANASVGFFEGAEGCPLRYAIFRTALPLARGTIVLLHGRNETIEKYFETIADLTALGFWVATFDWRGQGGSGRLLKDPLKGHVGRFAHYEKDLELFLEQIVLPDTRLPFFIVAHSTGGLVALSTAPRLGNRIERMVLTAPFVELSGQALGRQAIAVLMRSLCLAGLGRLGVGTYKHPAPFAGNGLTSDERRFARNNAIITQAPALELGRPTARWLTESFAAMHRVNEQGFLETIRVPTLILAAGRDPIVPLAALEAMDRRFRAGHLAPIDGARHELFQERDIYRDQVMAAIEAFIPGSDAPLDPAPRDPLAGEPLSGA
ncbi:MAG: alpha/beta fold hydrolase [Pararhizobium sp.]